MKELFKKPMTLKSNILCRAAIFSGASLMILIFSLTAPPNAEVFDMIGMELALVALALFLSVFPMGIYFVTNLFTLSAAAGSILKWYDKFPGYDRVVHLVSGLLLAYIGAYILNCICVRLKIKSHPLLIILFSGMFAFFGAGFWEIVEFLTDCVMHMEVQHGNTDTMGDIVAGFLGGVIYQIGLIIMYRRAFSWQRIKSYFALSPAKVQTAVIQQEESLI